MTRTDVCVVGLGYIGLPTAAIFAENGKQVHGVDVSPTTIAAVNSGMVPFVEPDLGDFVARAVARGTLTASGEPVAAHTHIIAVPTPFLDDHTADLSYIEAATRAVAKHLTGDELLILESTSPPGTTQRMADVVAEERPDLRDAGIKFAHCPERVLPGKIMTELVANDRIVGGITTEAAEEAGELYRTFCKGEILLTGATTAELAKLAENSFRDVNIAFANELSIISDRLGIDVWELIELANHHPRVNILQPGPGVGGHCIAVDPWFIVAAAPEESRLIRTAREVNDSKPHYLMDRIRSASEGLETPTVAMLGLAFKPNIDDLRESPALSIVRDYATANPLSRVLAVEPHVQELPASLAGLSNVALVPTDEALEAADVVVVLVDHDAFRAVPFERVAQKKIVDSKGLWR
ncbi:MAG: UDP-N-acetyl-D-mannosamine dehydrogenase [Arachnia sp.]